MEALRDLPRIMVFFAIASFVLFCNRGNCIELKDMQRINLFADQEYKRISGLLESMKQIKHKVWAEGDIDFFQRWLNGLEHERSKEYQSAIKWYQKASMVPRYEMSTYDVSLPLGRAFLMSGQRRNARKALRYFIERAEAELSGEEDQQWRLTEEGKNGLRKNVEFAKWLMALCEK